MTVTRENKPTVNVVDQLFTRKIWNEIHYPQSLSRDTQGVQNMTPNT